jgi:hypothetical protein
MVYTIQNHSLYGRCPTFGDRIECCGLDWSGSEWVQVQSSCERGNEPSGSIKCWASTEWLYNLWPLDWYSAPQS